jgi:hypothetical protein
MEEPTEKKTSGYPAMLAVVGVVGAAVLLKDMLPSSPVRYLVAAAIGGALAAIGYLVETKLIKK